MKQNNKRNTLKVNELKTQPGPLVIKNLLAHSKSDDFEDAKTEWELIENITSESHGFVENCELCNSRLNKENWIIQNSNTADFLRIGSECIKRFIQFAGTSSQGDSNTFFENKRKELQLESDLQTLYKEVIQLPLPLINTANSFKRKLIKFLELRGKHDLLESADGCKIIIDKILKISNPLPTDVSRLTDLIRGTLPVVRSKRKLKKEIFKEGSTLNKKGSKVTSSSLNYSESYNNPADKYK